MNSGSLNVIAYDASLKNLASSFNSGNSYLDAFLKGPRALDVGFGKTYVLLSDNNDTIMGYYNIGVGYIEQIRDNKRHKLGGAAHINCFALDEKYHGALKIITDEGVQIKLSDVLLNDCLERIQKIRSNQIGFTFVTLCSTRSGSNLYKRNDFEGLEEDMSFSMEESDTDCIQMYLPLDIE